MIRIQPLTSTEIGRVAPKKKKGVDSSGLFSGFLSEAEAASDSAAAAPVYEAQAPSYINPMFALQEVPDSEITRRQAIKQGKLTLDVLEDLRHSLLSGAIGPHLLTRLEKMVKEQRVLSTSPELNAVLDDIELRAAVELAKLEMSGQYP